MIYNDIIEDNYLLGFLINKGSLTNSDDLNSNSWRLNSDKGKHLNGTDLAPFPLGFFNAALHGDIIGRIFKTALKEKISIDEIKCEVKNSYYLTGSFVKGDGEDHAESSQINLDIKSTEDKSKIKELINKSSKSSLVLTTFRTPFKNTFSLIANGRKKSFKFK